MKAALIVILCILFTVFSEEHLTEEGVLVLTSATFPQAIAQYANLFVNFYASWDGHCKVFATTYVETARKLAETNLDVKLAQVDWTVEEELAQKYKIRSYPTLILFRKSLDPGLIVYEGPRTPSDIINWLTKKTSPSSVQVKTVKDIQILGTNSEVVVVFFGPPETEAFNSFLKVSINSDDEITFAHSHDQTLADEFDIPSNTIILFRKFDQEKSVLTGGTSDEAIQTFINENRNSVIFPSTEKAFEKIFREGLDTLFFIGDGNDKSNQAEAIFQEISKEVKGKLVLSAVNINDNLGKKLAEYLHIGNEQLPTIILVRASKNNLKYLFENEITVENVRSFIQDFHNNKLKPMLKSAPIPDQVYEDDVMVVVGKNFEEIVLDENSDVLVAYYAHWDGHWKSFVPVYSAFATRFKNVPRLKIAKMDTTANEIEGLNVDHFPSLKFYPKGKKHEILDYDGKLTLEDLSRYLKEHSSSVQQFNELILEL